MQNYSKINEIWLTLIFIVLLSNLNAQNIQWNHSVYAKLTDSASELNLENYVSYEGAFGMVIAKSHEQAQAMIRDGMRAMHKFSKLYKIDLPRVVLSTAKLEEFHINKLKTKGYIWWFDLEFYKSKIADQEKDLKVKVIGVLVDWYEGELDNFPSVYEALSNDKKPKGYMNFGKEISSLGFMPTLFRHELGHLMTNIFLLGLDIGKRTEWGYDNGTPDWLDEATATLVEGGTGYSYFETVAKTLYRKNQIMPPSIYIYFLHSNNKNSEQYEAMQRAIKKGTGSANNNGVFAIDSTNNNSNILQNHAYVFANFLMSTSSSHKVMQSLYKHLANQNTGHFETWLKNEGYKFNLPDSLEELDKVWNEWISERMKSYL